MNDVNVLIELLTSSSSSDEDELIDIVKLKKKRWQELKIILKLCETCPIKRPDRQMSIYCLHIDEI